MAAIDTSHTGLIWPEDEPTTLMLHSPWITLDELRRAQQARAESDIVLCIGVEYGYLVRFTPSQVAQLNEASLRAAILAAGADVPC